MQVKFPNCKVLACEDFVSKKGTRCGVLRFFEGVEGKVYRTMVFGDDVQRLAGVCPGQTVSVLMDVQGSRRDDTLEMYLAAVEQVG